MTHEAPRRERGSRRPHARGRAAATNLPPRARRFAIAVGAAVVGVLIYFTIHVLGTERLPVAILLLIGTYIAVAVFAVALLTVMRAVRNLRSAPYLLGRWIYRLLTKS